VRITGTDHITAGFVKHTDGVRAGILIVNADTGEHVVIQTTIDDLSRLCRQFLSDELQPVQELDFSARGRPS